MARVPLSEYDAKRLLFPNQLVLSATTKTTTSEINAKLAAGHEQDRMVVKVDQGVKKRGKQGLVAVNVGATLAVARIREWSDLGFSHFLIEPLVQHKEEDEKYLCLERKRNGWIALVSDQGGIDVEENWDSVRSVDPQKYARLTALLDQYHIATLEINPYILQNSEIIALDAAVEIDDAALGLAELTSLHIEPMSNRVKAKSELAIAALDSSTPASLKFRLINPEGSIWMLLSGGGASLVLADEVADLGLGAELANYGEYSGAPTDDDTYSYAKIILKQMLSGKSHKKALIIAGGVANFTDVAKTFRGLIRAMDEMKDKLRKVKTKVFVRRGGPNEKKGLAMMKTFLKEADLLGSIHGHDTPLTQVISDAVDYLK